jgi:predicted 3-demethylubiquinone-9 3-methyltransferase (glyoxalase superfamily)
MTNSLTPIVRDREDTEQKEEIDRSFEATRFSRKIEETIYISYYNIGYGWIMDGWGKTWQVKICTILFLSAIRLTI